MTKEEAERWRIEALQLAATVRAVSENMPMNNFKVAIDKALQKFNAFWQPIAEREINGKGSGHSGEADPAAQVQNRD